MADRPDAVRPNPASLSCSYHSPRSDGKDWPFEDRWRTEAVVGLARGIRAEQAYDRMPILADALEEAGCDDREFLDHCRVCQVHVIGCWVVETVLDYECRQPVVRRPPARTTRLGRIWEDVRKEMRLRPLTATDKLLEPPESPERTNLRTGCIAVYVIALVAVICLLAVFSRG